MLFLCPLPSVPAYAQNAAQESVQQAQSEPVPQEGAPAAAGEPALSLPELVAKSWEALSKSEFQKVYDYARQAQEEYGQEAGRQQKGLYEFPATEKIKNYDVLNNVATCLFIQGEALVKENKIEEAKVLFNYIISDFSFAQGWDPKGWYWKVAEKAQATLVKLETGEASAADDPEAEKYKKIKPAKLVLYDPGTEEIVDYEKYGEFSGIGTKDYKYSVKSQEGLSEAVGEGIHPNTSGVRWDPAFQEVKQANRLAGSHWDFIHSPDLEAAFIKWCLSPEPPGIKLFYTAVILERAGLIKHAIKAYYAILVHFPYTVGWTYWHTPWYVGQAALYRIQYLCKKYPQANMKLTGAKLQVVHGFDNDITNDVFIVNPGKLVKDHLPQTLFDQVKTYIERRNIRSRVQKQLGRGKVRLVQYANGGWQLLVDNAPYFIRGITYNVVKTGQSPDNGTLKGWMEYDYNHNGKSDGPYDAFVDANFNNERDAHEPPVGDFWLLSRMGVNTIRLYHQPFNINKEILRDMFKRYGIRVIMGDFIGKYALGSGASWFEGTDYDNPGHKKAMLESVKKMVLEFKDEPYILTWILGNENVYGVACNADKKPESFFKFVNEAAVLIKSLDQDHPVAIASGDTLFLDKFAAHCADVDIFGANVYRGDNGFGSYWQSVNELAAKPAFITEYGCPAYAYGLSREAAEEAQSVYLADCWEDITDNAVFGKGSGNAIGGILFEWLDEWWKAYEPGFHDTKGLFKGPFPDGFMHEEWLGVAGQGNGQASPFLRQLRKSYWVYQKLWKK